MDRNTGKDSAYRPLSDSPVAHTHHRETDPCYQGPRQVLARMPNLTTPDSPMDSTTRYGRSEHRGVGSGVSVKVLAGIAVGLVVVAVLGYLLVDQNKESDLAETPTWEPQVPAAEADAVPPWGSGLTASSPQASPESATQWNSPSPAPAWNTQVPGAPAGQPGDAPFGQPPTWQGEQNRVSSGPTELTATSAPPSETVWGQVNSPASSSPAPAADWGNPQQVGMWNNATSAQASAENSPSAQGPAWTQGPQTASAPNAAQGFVMPTTMPTPVATVDPNAPAADPNAAASYGTSAPATNPRLLQQAMPLLIRDSRAWPDPRRPDRLPRRLRATRRACLLLQPIRMRPPRLATAANLGLSLASATVRIYAAAASRRIRKPPRIIPKPQRPIRSRRRTIPRPARLIRRELGAIHSRPGATRRRRRVLRSRRRAIPRVARSIRTQPGVIPRVVRIIRRPQRPIRRAEHRIRRRLRGHRRATTAPQTCELATQRMRA